MMLVNALVVILGISLAGANVRDFTRIPRAAENIDDMGPPPEDEDDLKADLYPKVESVVINEDGDEIQDEQAIEELNEILDYDVQQENDGGDDIDDDIPEVDDYDDDDDNDANDGALEDDADVDAAPEGDEDNNAAADDDVDENPADDGDGDDTPVNSRRKRAAFRKTASLWEKGLIPYMFDKSLTDENEKDHIRAVIKYVEQVTCIRFIPYYPGVLEDNGLPHENILNFGRFGGCHSLVGKSNKRLSRGSTQPISACGRNHGAALHEIIHALGSEHEQYRSDSYSVYQVYRNNVSPDNFNWNELTSNADTINTYPYALDSIMHYSFSTGSLNGKRTMIVYDQDVGSRGTDGFMRYLDGQIINSLYKCAERRCPNHPHTCKNGGYVAYLNDAECRCVCPRGLGGDTCEEEYVPEPISSWPRGNYCLAADNTECSGTSLLTGYRKEHFTSLAEWELPSLFPQDAYNRNKIYTHRFCCSDDETDSAKGNDNKSYDWPRGSYCIFMYKDECPSGFTNGSLRFDDENTNNQNDLGGDAYPSGVYDNDTTEFRYCCRADGAIEYPMVMQNQRPFTLTSNSLKFSCPKVAGMYQWKMSYKFNTELTLDEKNPPYSYWNEWWGWKRMYFCRYTLMTYGCGGVEILDDTRRSVTIKSPNYPDPYNPFSVCSWTIKSPENTLMKVEFTHFNISVDSDGDCEHDFLEIRHWNPETTGRKFCGVQFPRGMVTYQNQMLLELQTSDLTPATGFEATISIVEASDLKYRTSGSYAGNVSYTQQYKKCLRWDEVPQCPHNMFSDATGLLGPNNYCRNPAEQFSRPWCYVDTYCYSDVCDVGGIVDCYDKSESCASLIINASYCGSDTGFEHCHKSCGFCGQDVVDPVGCESAPAVAESMVVTSEPKDAYQSGDVITYKERYTAVTHKRVCLTNGKWSGSDTFSGCPPGWVESLPGRCYKYFFKNQKTRAMAQVSCTTYGARLASARSEEEQRALEVVLPSTRHDGHRVVFGLRKSFPHVHQWIDGRNLTYTNWGDYVTNHYCVTLTASRADNTYYWRALAYCNWLIPYVCERFATCGDGYYASGDGVCYKYHGEDPKSRDDAQAVCESEGGQLAVGTTEQEHYAIVGVLPFFGKQSRFIHFGLRRSPNDPATIVWNNGSPVNFTKWAPDNHIRITNEGCITLRYFDILRTYAWDDWQCDASLPFVCQKPKVTSYPCSDSDQDCSVFKTNSALCTQQYHKVYANTNCRKTCGVCD